MRGLEYAIGERHGLRLLAERRSITGGLGSAVAEVLSEHCPVFLKRIGICNRFGLSGDADALINYYGLTAKAFVAAVKEVIAKKRRLSIKVVPTSFHYAQSQAVDEVQVIP